MDYLHSIEKPRLRDPVLVAAFGGWNDASEVATFSARYLVQQWTARRMAEIDSEEFYVFTETRPHVHIAGRLQRRIEWPANDFFFYQNPNGEHDFIVLVGAEPNLKWHAFTDTLLDFAKENGVTTLVTLGALVADVAHTLPVRLSGTGSSMRLSQRLRQLGIERTRYEGPTGIVGVLNSAFAQAGLPSASLWASVPDYLSAAPNLKASLAMLERLSSLLPITLDLSELRLFTAQFDRQVSEALAQNPEVQSYVRELEERDQGRHEEAEEAQPDQEQFPSGEAVIRELEEFLRRRQRGQGGSQPS
ncbi:MAG: PAC2 family protein [Chloroflexota bacterium]